MSAQHHRGLPSQENVRAAVAGLDGGIIREGGEILQSRVHLRVQTGVLRRVRSSLVLLVQRGDLRGVLVNLQRRAAGLGRDAARDLGDAAGHDVEALRHLAGRGEDALPRPRIVGVHA